ncbi:unnamed protein product, partial [Closterium sp. NIES-65]
MVRRREGYPFSRSPARPSCAASHHPPLTSHRCPPRPSPGCMISPYRPSAALPLRPVRQLLRAVALPLHSHLSPPLSTARRSFFASAMGSWALFGPPSYCLTAGAMGTLVYAVCAGLPVLLVACVGAAVHRLVPNVVSMADYVRRRFGLGARPWQGNTGDRLAHAMARPWLRAVREGEGHKGQRSNAFGSEPQVVMPRSQCVRPVCGVALLWPPSLHPLHAALALPPPTLPPTTWCRCTLPSVLWRASCRQHGGMCTAVTDGACCAATSTHTMRFLPSHSLPPLSLCTQQHHGSPFAVYISLLAVGNMGVAMAAEYTALGDLFHRLLHAPRLPIVMLTAATAMLYTAAGGLYVSIVTDQCQARRPPTALLLTWLTCSVHSGPGESNLHSTAHGTRAPQLPLATPTAAPCPGVVEPAGGGGGALHAALAARHHALQRGHVAAVRCGEMRSEPCGSAAGRQRARRRCWGEQRWEQVPSRPSWGCWASPVRALLPPPCWHLLPCAAMHLLPCAAMHLLPCAAMHLLPCAAMHLLPCAAMHLLPCAAMHLLPCAAMHLLPCAAMHLLPCAAMHLLPCAAMHLLPCAAMHLLPCAAMHLLPCAAMHLLPCAAMHLLPCAAMHLLPCAAMHLLPCAAMHLLPCAAMHLLPCAAMHLLPCAAMHLLPCAAMHLLPCAAMHLLPCAAMHLLPCAAMHLLPCAAMHLLLLPHPYFFALLPCTAGSGLPHRAGCFAMQWSRALLSSCLPLPTISAPSVAGLLAAWSGVYEPEGPDDSGNTILFSLFRGHPWALVAVALLAVTMSESAVDSLQNATVDAVAALLLAHPSCSASSKRRVHDKEGGQGSVQRQEEARLTQVQCTEHVEAGGGAREASQPQHTDPFPLVHRTLLTPSSFPTACPLLAGATTVHAPPASATHPDPVPSALAPPHHGPGLTISSIRALVLILNIPPLLVSLQGFNVLQLFLLVNLINTTSFLPLLLGVLQGPLSRVCITPASSATGCASGLLALVVWAKSQQRPGETYVESLARTFLDAYDYPPYLIAVGFSAVGMAVDRVNMGFVPEGPSDSTPLKPQSESSEAPPHGGADAAASHAPASGLPAFQYAHHPHHPPARGAYPPQFPPPPGCPSAVVVVAHGASGGEFPVFSPAPIPGLYMLPPRVPPSPDMVILGYETCAPPTGCCATATLSGVGWLAAIVAFIFCWPLTCLPCCIPQLHE